jgi:PAS domain S-box-containing protein
LVADDHPANLTALEAILAPLGHELVMVASGEEAVAEVARRDFALLLLDVQLAGMSGLEAAAEIKKHPRGRHVPVIFLTASGHDPALVSRGYSQGAVDYLVKPFDAEALRSKVRVFTDLYLQGEEVKAQARKLRRRERVAFRRRGEQRYRHLIDSMPHCMWTADTSGRIDYWNRAALDYCGFDAASATEDAFWAVLHPEDRADARAQWEAGVRGTVPFEREVRMKRASDGAYRWQLARAVPEREGGKAVTGWIATATDIGDQKRAEEALHRAAAHRDEFLSVASHELRTPLTSLKLELGNLSRLARRGEAIRPDRLQAKVDRLQEQCERLHRLTDALLDVSRIAAGRLELHLEDVDLAEVVADVGARFRSESERVGSALLVSARGPLVGRWDRKRLEQVVANLVSNAFKFGDCKPVEITAEGEDHRARLSVRDHGLGIAPRDQRRIFGRFERAASSRNFGGIGLGLWTVKQIVDALGGSIGVESELGAGSTFFVELPAR